GNNSALTGGVVARAGSLFVETPTALGAPTALAAIGKDVTAFFEFSGTVANPIQLAGTVFGYGFLDGTVTLTGSVTLTGPVQLWQRIVFGGLVNGPGSLDVQPGSSLTLTNNNSYAGGTKVENFAVVHVQANDALGVGTATTEVLPQGL